MDVRNDIQKQLYKLKQYFCQQIIAVSHRVNFCFRHFIQGIPGGKDLTSGECSLGQTIPI